jgi:hypothetical protein
MHKFTKYQFFRSKNFDFVVLCNDLKYRRIFSNGIYNKILQYLVDSHTTNHFTIMYFNKNKFSITNLLDNVAHITITFTDK